MISGIYFKIIWNGEKQVEVQMKHSIRWQIWKLDEFISGQRTPTVLCLLLCMFKIYDNYLKTRRHCGKQSGRLSKDKQTTNSTPIYPSRRIGSRDLNKYLYTMFIEAWFTIAKGGNNPRVHHRRTDKQNTVYTHMDYSTIKKECHFVTCYTMDEPWKHCLVK